MSCVLSWHTKSMRMLQNDENAKQKMIKQIERERKMMGQRNGGQRTRGSDSRDVRIEGRTKLTKEPERRKDEAKEGMICPWLPG